MQAAGGDPGKRDCLFRAGSEVVLLAAPGASLQSCREEVAFLWGDPGYVISVQGGRTIVPTKGYRGDPLIEDPFLCIHQIDCVRGDSASVHFSGYRWLKVDAGPSLNWSNSGKIVTSGPEYPTHYVDRI